jgi:hypothetical protein
MTVGPNELAIITEKRQKALVGATAEIDKRIKKDAHKDLHSVLLSIGSTPSSSRNWFYAELVKQYKLTGWKFVTIHYRIEGHPETGRGLKRCIYIHISQKESFPGRMHTHMAGDPFFEPKKKIQKKLFQRIFS